MKITKQTVDHMAYLARLPVTADDALQSDICRIMEYMNTVPCADGFDTPTGLHSVLREDEVGECLPCGSLNADAFIVPKAVE